MELLKSLGVNSTLWTQLACFIISYLAISKLVLKPYLAALHERENRTIGGEELATRIIEETADLNATYEQQTRAMHAKIKGYFEDSRVEASKEYEKLVGSARAEVDNVLKTNRAKITEQIQGARKNLSAEVPAVGAAIASKLAGKELSV